MSVWWFVVQSSSCILKLNLYSVPSSAGFPCRGSEGLKLSSGWFTSQQKSFKEPKFNQIFIKTFLFQSLFTDGKLRNRQEVEEPSAALYFLSDEVQRTAASKFFFYFFRGQNDLRDSSEVNQLIVVNKLIHASICRCVIGWPPGKVLEMSWKRPGKVD